MRLNSLLSSFPSVADSITLVRAHQELRRQFETLSELRNEIKSLQADNLKLYEKVRYLQSYRGDAGAKDAAQRGFQTTVRVDEELGQYKNKYEESMNPFEAFRGRVGRLACSSCSSSSSSPFAS